MADPTIIEGAADAQVAQWLTDSFATALAETPGPMAITVPGGSTPFPILERLAAAPLDWPRITVWPNDDRIVPDNHPASNVGRIRALLASTGAEIVTLSDMEQVPRFALAWVGMGADGHIASLFPNTDPRVDETVAVRRLMPDPLPPEAPFERITLTLPALLGSDQIVLVIRGEEKRRVLDDALAGRSDLPIARLLGAATQGVTCFV